MFPARSQLLYAKFFIIFADIEFNKTNSDLASLSSPPTSNTSSPVLKSPLQQDSISSSVSVKTNDHVAANSDANKLNYTDQDYNNNNNDYDEDELLQENQQQNNCSTDASEFANKETPAKSTKLEYDDSNNDESDELNNLNLTQTSIETTTTNSLNTTTTNTTGYNDLLGADATTQRCALCDKTFDTIHRLQRHMLCHDTNPAIRKFSCEFCEKAFKFKHHLKVKFFFSIRMFCVCI